MGHGNGVNEIVFLDFLKNDFMDLTWIMICTAVLVIGKKKKLT